MLPARPSTRATAPASNAKASRLPTRATAVNIALWYALLGTLWILCSGWVLNYFVQDNYWGGLIEGIKGWLYVLFTACLLAVVLDRHFRRIRRATQLVQESETRLRIVEDNLPESYVYQFMRGADGLPHFTHVSAGVERVHGVTPEEVKRDANWLLSQLEPAQAAEYATREAESFRNLTNFTMDLRTRRADGIARVIHVQSQPRRNEEGRVVWDGFAVDITGRQLAEVALLQSEQQFRTIFELASIGMAQADPFTGRLLRVNRKLCEITGYEAHELLLMQIRDITYSEDQQRDWELFQSVIRGEVPDYRMEKRYVCKNGSLAWVNVNMTVIRDAAGQPVRTMATIEDISDRIRTETALRLQSAALEAAANAILITDVHGTIEWANPAFTTMSGYTVNEVIGKNPRLLKSSEQDTSFYRDLWNTILAGKVWHGELTNRRKDGSLFQEDMTITALRDAQGAITHFIAIKQDITARKRIEAQFRQAQKMEAIGKLAGGVAHDFNNNLSVIFGYTEMLLETMSDPENRHDVMEIKSAAERSASLTRQLLAFSRRQLITLTLLDLNAVTSSMEKMLGRLIGENIRLTTRLAPDLQPVMADAGNIEQLVMNLVVNARDAMPDGGQVTISTGNVSLNEEDARHLPEARPGEFICLSVTDTGYGMNSETLQHIFEPFFSTKGNKGTGLGLSVIYGIIQQHNGWINVTSKIGQGTTFKVYLPAHTGATATQASGDGANSGAPPRGHGEKILLLEDDSALCRLTQRLLKDSGYEVQSAETAADARKIFQQENGRFDLLFTDVVLPDGNGFDVAEEFRASNAALGILITSGYTDERARWGDAEAKNFHSIQKPYDSGDLLRLIHRTLGERKPAK